MLLILLILSCISPLFSNKIVLSEHTNNSIIKNKHKHKLLDDDRKEMQYYIDIESINIRIHYDLTGIDAINPEDKDHNNIPDYIDSAIVYLKKTYDVEVNQLKWKAPISDSNQLEQVSNGGSGAIDVYIRELAKLRYYGYASEIPVKDSKVQSGYLVLDNNYTDDFYKTKSYDALKVTIAHEFHHIIQFAYDTDQPWLIVPEMLSTYMENKVFPEVLDMKNYVDSLFRNPLASQISLGDVTSGYMYNIFFHYTDLKYGQESVHYLWESLNGRSEHFLKVWDGVFAEKYNSGISQEFTEFVKWCYYSGDRQIKGKYFPFGSRFINLRPSLDTKYSEPSISDTKNLYPLGFNYLSIKYPHYSSNETSDTLDVLITNTNLVNLTDNPPSDTYFFATFSQQQNDAEKLSKIDSYVLLKDKLLFDFNLIEYAGSSPITLDEPYPSPLKLQNDSYMVFPVSADQKAYDEVELQILSSNMENILKTNLKIEIINNRKVVKLENLTKIKSTGVYYYSIKNSKSTNFGKFAVVK